jgi:hypothetical protein
MKKLLLLATLSLSTAFADWGITGEFLYLRPTIDDTAFVLIGAPNNNSNPIGQKVCNQFDYEPGFRVGGFFSFCDNNRMVEAYYTRLTAKTTKTVNGTTLFALFGRADFASSFENYTGSARSVLDLTYQRVDVNFVQSIKNNCDFTYQFFAGIQWADFDFHEDYRYAVTTPTPVAGLVRQKSSIWGVGPQVGLNLYFPVYTFCGCMQGDLSFVAKSTLGLLAAEEKITSFNALPETTVILNTNGCDNWRVIPNAQIRLGFEYEMDISCYHATFGVGYEFTSYFRGLTREVYPDDVADGLSYNNYYNFDFQGLYLSASVGF